MTKEEKFSHSKKGDQIKWLRFFIVKEDNSFLKPYVCICGNNYIDKLPSVYKMAMISKDKLGSYGSMTSMIWNVLFTVVVHAKITIIFAG